VEHNAVFTALVLAGRRGPIDPLAQSAGCSHKALVPVEGVPMLVRVIRCLRAVPYLGQIVVSTDDPDTLQSLPEIRTLLDAGALSFHLATGRSPAESVLEFFQHLSPREPLLVATADHPLLTPEMVSHFCTAAARSDVDVAAGAVSASLFRAHYPHSKRSFIPLQGESYCGTNLFALLTPRAANAVSFWVHAGQFRKRPWRLIRVFGLTTLVLAALRRLNVQKGLARVSRIIGARIAIVPMPFPECAIDVDTSDDLATAARILAAREATPHPPL
jgi:GTP:adenosylcobinamide-phosphate guanylyltransferase